MFFGKKIDYKDHKVKQIVNDLIYDTSKCDLVAGVNYKRESLWKTPNGRFFTTKRCWGFNNYMNYAHHLDIYKYQIEVYSEGNLKSLIREHFNYMYNTLYAFDIKEA